MSRRRSSRRRHRRSRAVTFPSSDGDPKDGSRWLFKAAVVTMLLLVAVTAVVAVTPTVRPLSHIGANEATSDVTHSAHSGETTGSLLRLKPGSAEDVTNSAHSGETTLLHLKPGSAEDVTHSAHSGPCLKPGSAKDVTHFAHSGETTHDLLRLKPTSAEDGTHDVHRVSYCSMKRSSGSPVTRLKDQLKDAVPPRTSIAKMVNETEGFQSWKKYQDKLRLLDRKHRDTAAFSDEERDEFGSSDLWIAGYRFQYEKEKSAFEGLEGYVPEQPPIKQVRYMHSKNNMTTVPDDFEDFPLDAGFGDLDFNTVHNPFKNVRIGRRLATNLYKSMAPRFEALKRYWKEQLLSLKKVRPPTRLPMFPSDLEDDDLDIFDTSDFTVDSSHFPFAPNRRRVAGSPYRKVVPSFVRVTKNSTRPHTQAHRAP
ncbi:Hypp1345 [Branchiostoma lanceolatum]|uniref:Hypp1345 protein n=1 Tax=Branchiostoma lanceolatum TaxID=7740 RepID=A0A8K0EIC1_BRALA|nr:Hypp1345 [Branchiostoma lanceolatum]